jgi:mutator protein MutT
MSTQRIAVAVVESRDHVLIGRRPAAAALGGLWEFPGGKIEMGETAEEAAIRECLEETGLHVVVMGEYPDHVQSYEHGTVHLRFFACRPCDPAALPKAPFQWTPRQSLSPEGFPEGNATLLRQLLARDATGNEGD